MKHYLSQTQDVLAEVKSSENGLTSAEAEQRLAENGKNKLKEAEKDSLFKKLIDALADPMIIMLIVAAAIQGVVAVVQAAGEFKFEDFADVGVILVVVIGMFIMSSRGLEGGGKLAMVLAIISLIPIIIILVGDIGNFQFSRISDAWHFPVVGYSDMMSIVLVLGCFGLGQWSSCAWETAAIYGPEYKDPGRDTPKALFTCGLICLALYFLVPFLMYGEIGQGGLEAAGYHSLHPIAIAAFGDVGGMIALVVLIIAMILIIQTGYLGSSRALHSMAVEGNLPSWFGKLNSHGMPVNVMLILCVLPMAGIDTSVMTVLSASAMGYAIANFVALAAFVKSRRDPKFKDLPRPFKAPGFYTYVGAFMCCMQVVLLVCLVYWSYVASGNSYVPAVLGVVILLLFIPIWVWVQKKEMAASA